VPEDRRIELRVGIHVGDVVKALRSTSPFCTSMAQRTGDGSIIEFRSVVDAVRLTMRSDGRINHIRSLRSPLRRDSVRSSSAPASRLYPTTSATRIAAILR
jgi:hypothetical protein